MKKSWHVVCAVVMSALLHAEADHEKECSSLHSRLEKWVQEKTEKLLDTERSHEKAHTVMTTAGLVQYTTEGRGPVLLSLHGGFGGWDESALIAEHFLKEGFCVLAVSRPGYLGTELPELPPFTAFTPAQQADTVIALLDVLDIPEVSVLGFGAGAPVAFALAQNYPDRVKAVVLESLGASPNEDFLFAPILPQDLPNPEAADLTAFLLHLSERFDFNSSAKEALEFDTLLSGDALHQRQRSALKHHDKYNLLKKLLNTMIPLSPRLPGILNDFLGLNYWTNSFNPNGYNTPTLIIQAIDDANGYFSVAQEVQQQLSSAQLLVVEGSGHFIWFGPYTKEWRKQATQFLRDQNGN
jgi:2-hydroxy-6-oxonona-2,4-dienedioate hydrolase